MTRSAWQLFAGAAVAVFSALLAPITLAENPGITLALAAPSAAQVPQADISNHRCLRCHADPLEKTRVHPDGTKINLFIDTQQFDHSVHAKQPCNGCHNNVVKLPHQKPLPKSIGCIECHKQKLAAQKERSDPQYKRLGIVVEQMEGYLNSIHAQPNKKDISKINATCYDCHDAHNIGTLGSLQRAEHRMKNPEVCGRCHEKQLDEYKASMHGKALLEKKDTKSAVCSDCHSTHSISSAKGDPMKLTITKNCGNCHEKARETYFKSYHGQVNKLGYTNTAKCYDCHGGHNIKNVDDPTSTIHVNNRLKTCNTCHKNADKGFLTFHAHGDASNFEKYPDMFIVSKFMEYLIYGVMLFFWTHVLLWFYRELMDHLKGCGHREDVEHPDAVFFRRFSPIWRWIHVLFAMSTMVLVITGTTLLFSHTDWAKAVMTLLGGPIWEGVVHRTAAVIWVTVFLSHVGFAMFNIWKTRKTFRWFGPTSMIPNWQDLKDIVRMYKWFLGFTSRPKFERWTYWQKFDYWAPFWGAMAIGLSGAMMFNPTLTSQFLPGWVFNLATIIHAEEALLATVFLFSVHFFNVHFRPEKFPLSTTIFTGAVPLEEFKYEHTQEYDRLVAAGELEKYLVKRPTRTVESLATILSALLILAGFMLLTLVMIGYNTMH
ncbi:MAG: cytochrome C [Hydrogenophilales bacterium]|nr:cytochrome C [Hydrogenophilales bacterium]